MTVFPLALTGELYIDGVWTDVTSDTLHRDGLRVTRGRSDEAGRVQPTRAEWSLRNTTGKYSDRNPLSPYYQLLGRNTQARFYRGTPHLGAGSGSSSASTSHVAPSVTATESGLLVCGWLAGGTGNYTVPGSMTGGTERDGTFSTSQVGRESVSSGATGTRTATFSASEEYASASVVLHGTSLTVEQYSSSVSTTIDDITLSTPSGTAAGWWLVAVQGWLRGNQLPMPDAPYGDVDGWIELADSGAIPADFSGFDIYPHVRFWVTRVKKSGTQNVIFPGVAEADTVSGDNHAHLYVVSGTVTDWDIRCHVEVSAWPPRWDVSEADVWTPVEGAGILRRLSQGASPLQSPLLRLLPNTSQVGNTATSVDPVGYWPFEDGADAHSAASGLPGGRSGRAHGQVQWASLSTIPGSMPVPDWRNSSASVTLPVSGVDGSNGWSVGFPLAYTSTDSWSPIRIFQSTGLWDYVRFTFTSTIVVDGVDSSGSVTNLITDSTDLSDGLPHFVLLRADASGGTVTWNLDVDGSGVNSGSASGSTAGAIATVRVTPRAAGDSAALGHVAVWNAKLPNYLVFYQATTGYAGEKAGRRIERLCHEQDIGLHIVGDPDDTQPMQAQRADTLLNLLFAAQDVDAGVLYETRQALALGYRTCRSLYVQAATVALDYSAREIAPPLEPVDDDQHLVNDSTMDRDGGSSARYVDTSSRLGVDTVGRYGDQATVEAAFDEQLPDLASWRVHQGTLDEARYPLIHVNLRSLDAQGKDTLLRTVAALDMRDLLTIANPPAWLPPDLIQALAEGYTETLDTVSWDLDVNASPASLYQAVGVRDDDTARRDNQGSTLNSSFVAGTDTSMSVASANLLWTTDGSYMPFDIVVSGVRLTVTAISGSSSPQTFTITQTPVNGVTKTISAGAEVHVWDKTVRGL